ncbi:daunorubicin ABC transporter ATP-binding protein, partial [Chloroflexota bacterium]
MTLLLTTHYMEEAEHLADRVGIIDHGRMVMEGTPGELVEQMGADTIHVSGLGDSREFIAAVQDLPFVQAVTSTDGIVQIGVDSGNR